ncbi:MAG: DUF4062 domain-containing protein [Anaerolineae bacterium]|nr:DUF4062 domain-containing protein [Anaerolineae bacterium]
MHRPVHVTSTLHSHRYTSGCPMQESRRHIRIFLSSPSDVSQERKVALTVIDQLQYHPLFRDKITVEVVAWDKPGASTPLLANMTPQEAINQGLRRPSECDIVVVILWSRIGTLLPAQYMKADGSRYLSGTEWEYLDALNSARTTGRPILIVYRRTEEPIISLKDENFVQKGKQFHYVEQFFEGFANPDGSLEQGFNQYEKPEDFRRDFETHLENLVSRLLEDETALTSEPETAIKNSTPWAGSPFPGLRAFTPDDAPIFFGRGRETDALVRRVAKNRFVAVVGASGSGKSSLVGAGLMVQLAANATDGSKDWISLRITPGEVSDNPFMALAVKLAPLLKRVPRDLAAALETNPDFISGIAQSALIGKPEWAELLLFIDQFEELFTLVNKQYLSPFIEMLSTIAQSSRIRVVMTMRSDFYHRCVDLPALASLLQDGSYPLSVPSQIALYEMITRPAERAGLAFEDGLPEQILQDTGTDSGALALMAYALDELYHNQDSDGQLTFAAYDSLGGVQGAIGKRAEKTFAAIDDEAKTMMARVFRELVEVDERGTATRQRASLSRLTSSEAATRLVDAFTDARLLVKDKDIVEVAHEALLRSWIRLATWIDETQGDLRLLRQVKLSAQEWHTLGQRSDYLWSHERLVPVYDMLERLQMTPDPVLKEFCKPEYERLFIELIDSNILDYRREAIGDRLARIGRASLPVLLNAFQHQNKWVRAASTKALIKIGQAAIPGLTLLLYNPDERLYSRAARALGAIGWIALPTLLEAYCGNNQKLNYALSPSLERIIGLLRSYQSYNYSSKRPVAELLQNNSNVVDVVKAIKPYTTIPIDSARLVEGINNLLEPSAATILFFILLQTADATQVSSIVSTLKIMIGKNPNSWDLRDIVVQHLRKLGTAEAKIAAKNISTS